MKQVLIVLLTIFTLQLKAQESRSTISLSYLGLYAINPGLRIGYEVSPNNLNIGKKQLHLTPQIAWYTVPDNFNDLLVSIDISQHFGSPEKNSYWSYGISLGYIYQSKILSFSQNLGTGNRENVLSNSNHFFHPSVNIAWHKTISTKSNLFFKYSLGRKFSGKAPNETTMFLEAGIEYSLK